MYHQWVDRTDKLRPSVGLLRLLVEVNFEYVLRALLLQVRCRIGLKKGGHRNCGKKACRQYPPYVSPMFYLRHQDELALRF
jgi:hypothetical protein